MIQRAILRPSRVLISSPRVLTYALPQRVSKFSPSQLSLKDAPRISSARFYSASSEEPPKDASTEAEQKGKVSEEKAEDQVAKELETKSKEIIDLKVRASNLLSSVLPLAISCILIDDQDKYLRSVADFRNLQNRTKRDVQSARDFAIQKFAKDLVESIDNLDRALSTVPEEKLELDESSSARQELINLYQGLKMTETILMQTLKKHGLERFDPSVEGEPFNPNLHEATFQAPMEGKEHGTVFHTQQKGFTLNGRVLRVS
jgi:molecular chaperone GrpE